MQVGRLGGDVTLTRPRMLGCSLSLSVCVYPSRRLGADLTSYPIPDGFERKEASMGKGKRESVASTQSYGYQTSKLRQIRAGLYLCKWKV